jgi:hypothetical protein
LPTVADVTMLYSLRMRFAVGDVHGYRRELRAALGSRGLVDAEGSWSGGDAEVWFAGDLMDRGPDGVGVVEDVMRWQREAEQVGGRVGSVLGNHDVLALAVRRFADSAVPGGSAFDGRRSFALSWMINGGQLRDQKLLTDDMGEWLANLPAAVRLDSDILLHADTTEYLAWGSNLAGVNQAISAVLHGADLPLWWELWRCMTTRYAFLGPQGPANAREVLDVLGGSRIVHGHSIIGDLRDIDSTSVEEAWSYADGLALAVDGGIYDGGPSLVVPLE